MSTKVAPLTRLAELVPVAGVPAGAAAATTDSLRLSCGFPAGGLRNALHRQFCHRDRPGTGTQGDPT
jgi:hypothetical protein